MGPGTAAAAAKARKVDTLGRRIDRQAKSSPVSFQASVAVYAGRERHGHILARGNADFEASDRDNHSIGIFRTQSTAARLFGRRAMTRRPLANRRLAETFELTVAGLRYTCTVGRFPDGSIAELFLNNHKSNSAADTNARDSAIVFSIAVQCGADPEVIKRALSRDSHGRALGLLGTALDLIAVAEAIDDLRLISESAMQKFVAQPRCVSRTVPVPGGRHQNPAPIEA